MLGGEKLSVALPLPGVITIFVGGPGGTAAMLKLCVTCCAGLKLALPAWLAVSMHRPAATTLSVLPETRQIAVVLLAILTASPELAVALSVAVPPAVRLDTGSKVMLWLVTPLLKLAVTLFAASIVTLQVGPLLPLHAPPQPAKLLLPLGIAVNVTLLPLPRCAVQVPELTSAVVVQAMPPLITLPEPAPLALTDSANVLVGALRTRRTRLLRLRASL